MEERKKIITTFPNNNMVDSDSDEIDRERMLQDLDSPYAKRQCFHHNKEDDIYDLSTEEWSFEEGSIDDGEDEGPIDEAALKRMISSNASKWLDESKITKDHLNDKTDAETKE
jgi:hypothetical protein